MQRQCRLVRDYALALGPEPSGNQLLMLASGEVNEAVDASSRPYHAPRTHVLQQELRRVPSLSGLLRGEVARLCSRRLVEAVPVGWGWLGVDHARNATRGLVLCKIEATGDTIRNPKFSFVLGQALRSVKKTPRPLRPWPRDASSTQTKSSACAH